EAGPDAGKVMAGLMKRRIPVIMPLVALIALVSGMWLFQRLSGGNMKALMAKSLKLMQSGDPAPRPEIQRLQARASTLGKLVSYMLLGTLGLMAIARYL